MPTLGTASSGRERRAPMVKSDQVTQTLKLVVEAREEAQSGGDDPKDHPPSSYHMIRKQPVDPQFLDWPYFATQ